MTEKTHAPSKNTAWTHVHLLSGKKGRFAGYDEKGGVRMISEQGWAHVYSADSLHLMWAPLTEEA